MARPNLLTHQHAVAAASHAHNIVSIDPLSLEACIDDIYDRLDAPGKAVIAAMEGGEQGVVFVIAGGQSVPLSFKKGDDLEPLFAQLRLLLG